MEPPAIDTTCMRVGELIEKAQQLRDHGRYKEATELLQLGLESQPLNSVEIALELGEALQYQGYWAKALETWVECLKECTASDRPCLFRLRMRMNICLLRPMVGENMENLSECLAEARLAYDEFQSLSPEDNTIAHDVSAAIASLVSKHQVSCFVLLIANMPIPRRFPSEVYIAKCSYLRATSTFHKLHPRHFDGSLMLSKLAC